MGFKECPEKSFWDAKYPCFFQIENMTFLTMCMNYLLPFRWWEKICLSVGQPSAGH